MTKILQKKLFIAYLILLISGFIYVNNLLKTEVVTVSDKPTEEEEVMVEKKDVSATFVIEDGRYKGTYTLRLTNKDSVGDFLRTLRQDKGVYYETVSYINADEIVMDDKPTPQGKYWRVYLGGTDITYNMSETMLSDNATYYLRLVDL